MNTMAWTARREDADSVTRAPNMHGLGRQLWKQVRFSLLGKRGR